MISQKILREDVIAKIIISSNSIQKLKLARRFAGKMIVKSRYVLNSIQLGQFKRPRN